MHTLRCAVAGLAVAAFVAAPAVTARAQETTTGAIAGQVVDTQQLPVPGATVTVQGAQGTKTFVTDAQGNFSAPFLTPGTYTVTVQLEGFRPASVENVAVTLGRRTEIPNITMRPGQVTEQVEVVAAQPAVDVTTAATGANLDSEFLAKLPVQRRVSDALYLAPGVIGGGTVGHANPSIDGASGLENQYVIDGVNVSNSGYGGIGSYSIEFGSLGTSVPFDFVDQIQVKTAGYEAEFGQATGGIVQAVTKSGGNQFAGSGFVYWQPEQLQGDFKQTVLPNLTRDREAVNTTSTMFSDVGATLGGPILQNRLFFFGALDHQWSDETLIAPIGVPLRAALDDQTQKRRTTPYSGKVTWQATPVHQLSLSVFGDPSTGDMGPQRREALTRTDTAAFSSIDYGGHNQTFRYEGVLGSRWLLTGSIAHAANSITETPSVDAYSIRDTTGPTIVRSGGVGFYEVGNDGSNIQYQAKTTYAWRNNELRGGFLFEQIHYDNIINRTGPTFTLPNGQQTVTGAQIDILPDPTYGRIYRVTRANTSNVRQTRQHYAAFFVQDTWTAGRVTVKPGIRYEQQTLIGNLKDFTWDGNWAPRIGVTWDPTGSGRAKIYGNFGRYFAKVPNDLAARALSADAGVTRADYFDENLTMPVPDGTLAADTTTHLLLAGQSASTFDPNSKSTYSDEYLVGSQYEVVPNFSIGLDYTHRNFGRVLEDVGTVPLTAYFLYPDQAGNSVEYFITNPDEHTQVASFPGLDASFEKAIHDYDAVTLTAERRFNGRWGLQSSYRWARLHGTFEGFFRNDNGQSDPAITSLFDFPTNSLAYSQIGVPEFGFRGDIRYLGSAGAGPLPTDRTHQFKIYGNYLTNVGVNVGLGFTALSGTPLTALAANPYYENDGEIPETPRGGGFQTVDGVKTRTPWMTSLDLHADYRVPLMTSGLAITADVFNVLNRRAALDYDNYTEASFQVPNPDFGSVIRYQNPISARFGLRLEF